MADMKRGLMWSIHAESLDIGPHDDAGAEFYTSPAYCSFLTTNLPYEDRVITHRLNAGCADVASMLSGAIEALYIYNSQTNEPILTHVYRGRPCSAHSLLSAYLARPVPRPSVAYFPGLSPPTTAFTVRQGNLLLTVPATDDTEPLFVLEFLHRAIEALEEFLGAPLLAHRIENNYDITAQLISELCDAGLVNSTEPNALRDAVVVPGWVEKLLGGVGLPGSTPSSGPGAALKQQIALRGGPGAQGPALPWRRANVKHTSNELYVDIVETLHVTLAPSGRPLAARAHGSVLFTARISGVPDLILQLTVPGGSHTIGRMLEFPSFHPCVRLARWREKPGELSFVPPDGRFMLASYTVDLLPEDASPKSLSLPARVEVDTGLGNNGTDFEVRLILSPLAGSSSTSLSGSQSRSTLRPTSAASSGRGTPMDFLASLGGGGGGSSSGTPAQPILQDVEVSIRIPRAVRAVTDLRPSRGEAAFTASEHEVSWRLSSKDAASPGVATLRCTVVGPYGSDGDEEAPPAFDAANGEYVAEEDMAYQAGQLAKPDRKEEQQQRNTESSDAARRAANAQLMPRGAAVSFGVKGWVPSGVRVDSLNIDSRRSRGLGEGVRPVKGAKYLAVSRRGVETRC